MTELLKAIGAFVLCAWIAGSIGVIDFKVCMKPVGQCEMKAKP